jgi:nucleoside-triphosphatase THEP1
MLGFIISEKPGQADAVLQQLAQALQEQGIHLTGAVQETVRLSDRHRKSMALHLLPNGPQIGISQDLGPMATGCSLDPDGLEQAVGLIVTALNNNPQILLLNKFGKQEAEGRGFRPVIGEALARDIPVLIGVGREKLPLFQEFAGDMAQELPHDLPMLLEWCQRNIAA